jgi:hypothetical protein
LPSKLHSFLGSYFPTVDTLFYLVAFVLVMFSCYLALKNREFVQTGNGYYLKGFWLGAGIYIGTFLLGNNWDYRLMFLLFCIPTLIDWSIQKDKKYSLVAKITLTACMVSFWYLEIWRVLDKIGLPRFVSFAIDEFANWILFTGLVFLFAKTIQQVVISFIPDNYTNIFRMTKKK